MPDSSDRLRIWCNLLLPDAARRALEDGVAGHTLVSANRVSASNLDTSPPDADLLASDVAFGQPNPRDMIESARLNWIHLSTAGYTLYDRDDLRSALRARGSALTNSSSVYAEPCAQHVLAMMLALSRRLPQAWLDQQQRKWDYLPLRAQSRLLRGNSVAIVGYGAIGRRLVEMLAPFEMKITTVRRTPRDDEGVRSLPMERASEAIATADHIVNLLPAGANTKEFFDAALFARIKRGAIFYNVGAARPSIRRHCSRRSNRTSARRGLSGRDQPRAPAAGRSALERAELPHHPPQRRRPRGRIRAAGASFP
jgi:phosphoglycerate dehydrogenase-like enzyme